MCSVGTRIIQIYCFILDISVIVLFIYSKKFIFIHKFDTVSLFCIWVSLPFFQVFMIRVLIAFALTLASLLNNLDMILLLQVSILILDIVHLDLIL